MRKTIFKTKWLYLHAISAHNAGCLATKRFEIPFLVDFECAALGRSVANTREIYLLGEHAFKGKV